MELLPDDLLFDNLSRVPAEDIHQNARHFYFISDSVFSGQYNSGPSSSGNIGFALYSPSPPNDKKGRSK